MSIEANPYAFMGLQFLPKRQKPITWLDDSSRTDISSFKSLVGSSSYKPISVGDSPYSILPTDELIFVDTSSGNVVVTLPTAVSVGGKAITIKNEGSGLITVNTTLSQTIDDLPSGSVVLLENDSLEVASNNTNWKII